MCKKFMCHHSMSRMLYVVLVAMFATTGLVAGIYATTPPAQATPGMMPMGGHILYNVPFPIPNLPPLFVPCPPHIVIIDFSLGVPKPIGITLSGLSTGPTFEFYNLYTPGVAILGEYAPVPIPTCIPGVTPGVYYPVFPAMINFFFGGLYQIGTGGVPIS